MKKLLVFLFVFVVTAVAQQVGDGLSQNIYSGAVMESPNRELSIPAGRWLSPDPVGTGWNQYRYPLDPNNSTDTSGLRDLEGSSGMWDLSGWGPEFGSDILGAQVFFNMDPLTQNYQPDDPTNSLPDPGASSPEATSITVNNSGDIIGSAGDSQETMADMGLFGISLSNIIKNILTKMCFFCGDEVEADPTASLPTIGGTLGFAAGIRFMAYHPLNNYVSHLYTSRIFTNYISPTSKMMMEEFGAKPPYWEAGAEKLVLGEGPPVIEIAGTGALLVVDVSAMAEIRPQNPNGPTANPFTALWNTLWNAEGSHGADWSKP